MQPHPEIDAVLADLGLTLEATFVPFSHSRNAKPDPKPRDMSLNWRVTLRRNDRDVYSCDYSAGIAHAPYYKAHEKSAYNARRWPQDAFAALTAEVEQGFAVHVAGPLSLRPDRKKPLMPDTRDVVYSLLLDGSAIDSPDFESWAADCDCDPDSRAAEAAYRECLRCGLALRAALGDAGLARLQEAFQDY
jgi:hypothetical protein